MNALDQWLFLLVNAGPDTPAWALQAGVLLAKRLIWLLPPLLIVLWLIGRGEARRCLLRALVVTALALGLNAAIGHLWPVPRPFVLGLGHTWLAHAPTPSFPSNHMAILLSCTLTLWRGAWPRTGRVLLAAALVIAVARVFVGVHFPLDMLGAALTAGLAWWAVSRLWRPRPA